MHVLTRLHWCSRHFYLERDAISKMCDEWLELALQESGSARYDGLVMSQNPRLAESFKESPTAYHDTLADLVKQLKAVLATLELTVDDDEDDEDEDDVDDDQPSMAK